jgi:hypothetical protein
MQWNKFTRFLVLVASVLAVAAANSSSDDGGAAQPVSVVHVPQGGEPIAAQIAPDGAIHLLYNLGDIPYYMTSSDGGATFTTPLPVVNQEARKQGLKFDAWSVAVGKAGAIYVAMSTNNWQVKLPNVPEGLVYATLSQGAKAFTPVRSLNEKPSEGFCVAADGQGRVAATWLSNKLYANFSTDNGRTFTANAELNTSYDPCNCCTTRSVYGANGDLAVLYREKSNDDRDMYLVIQDKTGHLTRTRISSTPWHVNACPMTYYALTSTKDGYVAAWPTKGDIYFARIDRTGAVLPPGEVKTPGRSGMRTGLVALSGTDGGTLIAWKRDGELSWQLYNAQGVAQGAVESVPSAGKGAAGVTDQHGKFILFE